MEGKFMKIVAINGSPRKNGNTAQVLEVVRREVEAAGVEFQVFQPGAKVHPCMACYHCLNTGSLRCVQTDDMVNDIIAACIEADGILLAAPVYHGGISGNMKCVLDRLMLAAGCGVNQLHHKVGGALCTLRRSGGMETYQQLLGTMDAMEMVIVTSDYWGAVHGADPGEALKDEEGMEVAARLGRDMAWMVKVLAESRVPVPESTRLAEGGIWRMSPLYDGSNGDGWFSVFVIVPVIGLVIWGLNTFWLHRLKKGDMDYSPEGFRKRARIFAIILAAVLLGVPLLAALLLWNRH